MIDMARKDNKGRNLKTGEYQRPDGRYEYRYKDEITGKRNSVYAADLASLREMEKKINKDMDDLLFHFSQARQISCINRITLSGNFILVAILITSIRALVFTCF